MDENKKQLDTPNKLINIGLGLMLGVAFIQIIKTMDVDNFFQVIMVIGLSLVTIGVLGVLLMKRKPNKSKKQIKNTPSNK